MEGEEVDITAANDHGWLQVFLEGTWQLIAVSLNFLGNLGFFFFFMNPVLVHIPCHSSSIVCS